MAVSAYASMADRPRARDLGIAPGTFPPGPLNAITDVAGVRVGHVTIIEGDTVRTGVTADPAARRQSVSGESPRRGVRRQRVRQARRLDAGERARHHRVADRADQHAVGRRRRSRRSSAGRSRSPATTTCDRSTRSSAKRTTARLNDIRGLHVTREHVAAAVTRASDGPVEEGAVGAGTGTVAFGWKGGIGTSSRRIRGARRHVDGRRSRPDELRRTPRHRRRAGLEDVAAGRADGRQRAPRTRPDDRRRLLHDRRRDRCAARCARSSATGRARDLCARADRVHLLERQRRFRDRVLDASVPARDGRRHAAAAHRRCRPTACRRSSRRSSRRPRKPSTTRC